MSYNQEIELDILKMDINQSGVQDFYWPLSLDTKMSFVCDIMEYYVELVNRYDDADVYQNLSYKLAAKYFLSECVAIFQGDYLRKRFEDDGVKPLVPKNWQYWPSLFDKTEPPEPSFMREFMRGPVPPHYLKKLFDLRLVLKLLKSKFKAGGRFSIEGLRVAPITDKILEKDIVASQRTPVVIKHASVVNGDVYFCRSSRWFSCVSDAELGHEHQNHNYEFESNLFEQLESLYEKNGLKLGRESRSYLENIFRKLPALFRVHYNRLFQMPKSELPTTLWTGTGGHSWDTMLRAAVIKNGGRAYGHDHGCGAGHINNPRVAFNELWACSGFYTFNDNQAAEVNVHAKNGFCMERELPQAFGVPVANKASVYKHFERFKEPDFQPKKIMFMGDVYDMDIGRAGPGFYDVFLIDFQVRLLSTLKAWGHDVVMKIHPETLVMPPNVFEDKLGIQVETDWFENVLEDADLVIYLALDTTAFNVGLSTNVPIILMPFYETFLTNKAQKLLEKRCCFVQGNYDQWNRGSINWSRLKDAIEEAPSLCNNREFFDYYYA